MVMTETDVICRIHIITEPKLEQLQSGSGCELNLKQLKDSTCLIISVNIQE
jgi:hypothetical protein